MLDAQNEKTSSNLNYSSKNTIYVDIIIIEYFEILKIKGPALESWTPIATFIISLNIQLFIFY